MLELLSQVGIVFFAFAFIFHMAARKEVSKDEEKGVESAPRMLKMKRITGRIMGVTSVLVFATLVLGDDESTPKEEEVAQSEQTTEQEVEEVDYSEMARSASDVRDLETALKKLDKSIESIRLEGNLAVVRYDSEESAWSENTMVKEFATDSTKILAIIQENPNYSDIAFERFGTLVDEKGNERESGLIKALYFEADIDALNFENFTDMVWVDASKFYTNATGYAINGAIYPKIETELQYNMKWANDPETDVYNVYF